MASFLALPLSGSYVRGDTFPPLILTLTDDQVPPQPIDLTGARIRMSWRNKATKQVMRLLDSNLNQITVSTNVVTIQEFINDTPAGNYDWDIEIDRPSQNIFTPIIGTLNIVDDVTK